MKRLLAFLLILLLPLHSSAVQYAPITFLTPVGAWSFVSGANATGLVVTKSVTAGNFLIVSHANNTGIATATISDNGATPNSWAVTSASKAQGLGAYMWTAVAKTTGSITVTIANSGGGPSTSIAEYTSPFAAPVEDVTGTFVNNGAGSSSANGDLTGSVTTVTNGDLVVSMIFDTVVDSSTQYAQGTSPNAFTKRTTASVDPAGASNQTFAIEDFVQTTAAAINPTWTATTTTNYYGFTVAFKSRAVGVTGHIQSAGNSVGSGNTVSTTLAALPKQGNLVLCGIEIFDGSVVASITSIKDENNNNYTVTPGSPSALNDANSGQSFQAYLLSAPANAGKTITVVFSVSGSGNTPILWVSEFSYQGTAVFDTDAKANGTSTNPRLPTIGSQADELLYFNTSYSGTPNPVNSPWTLGTAVSGELSGYIISSSGANIAVSYQASGGAQSWSNMAQAIKFQ